MKLSIELVPSTCWYTNVRSSVSKEQWNYIRKQVYTAAYDTCEICGGIGDEWPVECHEVWNYNDVTHIQKLERMIALCPMCHAVKHAARSMLVDHQADAIIAHFNKINGFKNKYKSFNEHFSSVMQEWVGRSAYDWTLDLSNLKDYGIDVSKLTKESYKDDEAS